MSDIDAKIKVLFLSSDPIDASRLRLGKECREIEEQLNKSKQRNNFVMLPRFSVRPDDIIQAILESNPQIVHFSGHGSITGNLCVENDKGEVHEITPDAVSSLFQLVAGEVQVVLLNACFSEKQAYEISKHIDYVIGMKREIGDVAAIHFAIGFYRALGAGRSIEDSFKFGIVQLKMMNIKEELTPVLIKKSVKLDVQNENTDTKFIKDLQKVKTYYYDFLLNDQITETGAWGISQIKIMEEASGRKMSENDRREGGIISTYLTLRGLLKYEENPSEFRLKNYSKNALNYFLQRQTRKGSFGRFVLSRSGLEIHSSIRHTALAVSSLIDLGGPPGAAFRGINFINNNWSIRDILDDASPNMAIASIVHTIDKFISSPYYLSLFTDEEKKKLKLSEWSQVNITLLRELTNLSRTSEFKPFWMPYGGNKPLLYLDALTTIDLLSFPLPQGLRTVVCDILTSMFTRMTNNGGIPYNLETDEADLGITIYFYSLINRDDVLKVIHDKKLLRRIKSSKSKIQRFILKNWNSEQNYNYTQCDTIASLFFIDR